jgi:hypothetical protein
MTDRFLMVSDVTHMRAQNGWKHGPKKSLFDLKKCPKLVDKGQTDGRTKKNMPISCVVDLACHQPKKDQPTTVMQWVVNVVVRNRPHQQRASSATREASLVVCGCRQPINGQQSTIETMKKIILQVFCADKDPLQFLLMLLLPLPLPLPLLQLD